MQKNKPLKIKNVALCFSGQVKKLELCYPYIKKNLLDHIGSYDIFCCEEDDENLKKIKLLKPIKTKKIKSSEVDRIIEGKLKSLNKQNYKTIIYPESFSFNFRNIYQQLFKIDQSFKLLEKYMGEENISYKYFIRIRFDFFPLDGLKIEDFKIRKNEVVVPILKGIRPENEIIDMFCITSDFLAFKSYCSLYSNFRNVVQKNISIKPTFFQKLYFFFEKNYSNFFLFIFKKSNKKQNKLLRNLLGLTLLLPKMFYKDFKFKNKCNTEKAIFYHLKSENKLIRKEIINFVIVRSLTDGLLIFGK